MSEPTSSAGSRRRDPSSSARSQLFELLEKSRDRLRRMVRLRLDARLQGRIDPSDVIQEAYVDAIARYDEYRRDPRMSAFLWLRFLTGQKLLQLHRRHIRAAARSVTREIKLDGNGLPQLTSGVMAAQLADKHSSPSSAAARAELALRVQQALDAMAPNDREILALRHFEQLTNAECAEVLGLRKSTASARYIRALERLDAVLTDS